MIPYGPDGIGDDNGVMESSPVLYRPRSGAVVAGVCAGLGRRWQVDPVLLRIAVAVLTMAGGLGAIAYLAAVLLIPREGSTVMPIRTLLPFTRTWTTPALVAAVGFGCAVLVAVLGGWSGIGLGPLLVIGGVWFIGDRGSRQRLATPRPAGPTPFEQAAEAWRQRLLEQRSLSDFRPGMRAVEAGPALSPSLAAVPGPVPAIRTRPPRRGRWLLALGLIGAGMGVVALLDLWGVSASPTAYAAAVLLALGVALVASTRRGRPRLLLPATVVAGIVTAAMMLPTGPDLAGVGEVRRAYATQSELPGDVTLGLGEITLDLSELRLTGETTTSVRVGAGTAKLTLPEFANTEVTWQVKAGEYLARGEHRSGLDLAGREVSTPVPGGPTLHLHITVDAGTLEVIR